MARRAPGAAIIARWRQTAGTLGSTCALAGILGVMNMPQTRVATKSELRGTRRRAARIARSRLGEELSWLWTVWLGSRR